MKDPWPPPTRPMRSLRFKSPFVLMVVSRVEGVGNQNPFSECYVVPHVIGIARTREKGDATLLSISAPAPGRLRLTVQRRHNPIRCKCNFCEKLKLANSVGQMRGCR